MVRMSVNKIGDWWVPSFNTIQGESAIISVMANFLQSTKRGEVGGVLYITNKRVLFSPHWLDYILAGKKVDIMLSEIIGLEKIIKSQSLFCIRNKEYVVIKHLNGISQFFVDDASMVISEIEQQDLSGDI